MPCEPALVGTDIVLEVDAAIASELREVLTARGATFSEKKGFFFHRFTIAADNPSRFDEVKAWRADLASRDAW